MPAQAWALAASWAKLCAPGLETPRVKWGDPNPPGPPGQEHGSASETRDGMTWWRHHDKDSKGGLAARALATCGRRARGFRHLLAPFRLPPEARGSLSRFPEEELVRVTELGSNRVIRPHRPARKQFAGWTGSRPATLLSLVCHTALSTEWGGRRHADAIRDRAVCKKNFLRSFD